LISAHGSDIHNFVDIARIPLRPDEKRFVEEIASSLAPWGLPPSSGRVYGYLLLRQKPVGIDEMAADLGLSRAGTWAAARVLERFGHVRRYGSVGSKRALYAPSDNYAAPLIEQNALYGRVAGLLMDCARSAAPEAAEKLEERASFYLSVRKKIEAAIDELNAQRDGKGG
jgi:DNA-binding transcriptional regulator GbsR (MarR family)